MTETGKVFLRYLYKRFGWKVIHHRKKLFRIIHKRAFETSMKKLKFVIFTNAPCKGLNSNNKTVTVHSVPSNSFPLMSCWKHKNLNSNSNFERAVADLKCYKKFFLLYYICIFHYFFPYV